MGTCGFGKAWRNQIRQFPSLEEPNQTKMEPHQTKKKNDGKQKPSVRADTVDFPLPSLHHAGAPPKHLEQARKINPFVDQRACTNSAERREPLLQQATTMTKKMASPDGIDE